ncbi:MAG: GNAT family N-acetyltransferase [Rudaea sp.]|uniref:GNAT family N-acetyltransferase n=1 Tax=Rudaea sp. TaxID=2136325 RepID=UPI0039E2E0A1
MHDIDTGMLPTERESNGLSIRKYEPGDVAGIVEAVQESVPTVGAWLDWCNKGYGTAEAEAWITHAHESWDKGDSFVFAVSDATSGDYLGGVGLSRIDHEKLSANLGYWIRQSYQGRGVGTQAARLAVGYAFEVLKLTQIEVVCGAANRPSRRVAEKTGARFQGLASGRLTYHGKSIDAAVYTISAPAARRATA